MEEFLLQIHRPGQYTGGEWNVSRNDLQAAAIRFALCFPDLYEIGMSNLGIRILYGLLNNQPDIACERFFSPEPDLEGILRSNKRPLCSLESRRPLKDFDIAGFSLGSELLFTNVLNILDLSGIPLKSAKRGNDFPLVVGGGPATLNPEPMHEFFDFFVIGEAEELILEITQVYKKRKEEYKAEKISKTDLLLEMAALEGVYVPSFYEVSYGQDGSVSAFYPVVKGAPEVIKKRFVKDFSKAYFPVEWLVPYVQVVHDRITMELMRGCPNQCRFCQARTQYFPFRLRDKEKILTLAQETYRRTGYEEISLGGLSVSDYPYIEELSAQLISCFKERAVSISLPSIKAKTSVGHLSRVLAGIKKTGLTFAPEAGSPRLRGALAKNFDEDQFFGVLGQAYASGYQHVKLYFMIGLPGEEKSDLDALVDFCVRVSEARKKTGKGAAFVNISINTLIPKPHTAFQWLAMEGMEAIKEKQEYVRTQFKKYHKLEASFHNLQMSFLEGVFSRGNRLLSQAVQQAFERGARFDAWSNYFYYQRWEETFREKGIDPCSYLKEKSLGARLAWDHIDIGIPKESLYQEFKKVVATKEDKV